MLTMIVRICEMERCMDQAAAAVKQMQSALDAFRQAQDSIALLSAYLGSDEWRQDLKADENGLLPSDLKRGVLSEDGIWNLLDDYREMALQMNELSQTIIDNK
jgi:hypothetical protein